MQRFKSAREVAAIELSRTQRLEALRIEVTPVVLWVYSTIASSKRGALASKFYQRGPHSESSICDALYLLRDKNVIIAVNKRWYVR